MSGSVAERLHSGHDAISCRHPTVMPVAMLAIIRGSPVHSPDTLGTYLTVEAVMPHRNLGKAAVSLDPR